MKRIAFTFSTFTFNFHDKKNMIYATTQRLHQNDICVTIILANGVE